MTRILKQYWLSFREALGCFMKDNAMKMSASLSYYTVFSIAPMLLVIISIAGLFLGREAIEGEVYRQIEGLVGSSAAVLVQDLVKKASLSGDSTIALVLGIGTMLMGATGVFVEIQDSINAIWSLKAKPRRGWLKFITNRLLSLSMVMSLGFLLLVSLMINAGLEALSQRLLSRLPESNILLYVMNLLLILVFTTILFAGIFRVLPDARISWRDTFSGAIFTALLFMAGKFGITYYLGSSKLTTVYGAAGSLALMLAWVYYSSVILFFGAEFTKVYASRYGRKIVPNDYAVFVVRTEEATNADAGAVHAKQQKEDRLKEKKLDEKVKEKTG